MLPIIKLSTSPKGERFAWSRNNLAVILRIHPLVKYSMLWLSLKSSCNRMSRANNQRSLNFSQQHGRVTQHIYMISSNPVQTRRFFIAQHNSVSPAESHFYKKGADAIDVYDYEHFIPGALFKLIQEERLSANSKAEDV